MCNTDQTMWSSRLGHAAPAPWSDHRAFGESNCIQFCGTSRVCQRFGASERQRRDLLEISGAAAKVLRKLQCNSRRTESKGRLTKALKQRPQASGQP